MAGPSVRLDLRAALPVAALGVVVLVIIFVELCGREDVEPPVVQAPTPSGPTSTPGPSPTVGPSPTAAPEQPTATREAPSGGEDRDVTRMADLEAIQEALEEYRQENRDYPDTDGNVQTLCAFAEADAGCDLREVLSPLPLDPLGDPASNGYWYASSGSSYTLYAQRESGRFPECEEHPQHLEALESLICIQGP